MLKGIVDSNILLKDGIRNGDIFFDNGKISFKQIEGDIISFDKGLFVVPGFIDEHIHGANNCDFMDGKIEGIETISKALLQEGVTGFLATRWYVPAIALPFSSRSKTPAGATYVRRHANNAIPAMIRRI